jgi:hypothetical protein
MNTLFTMPRMVLLFFKGRQAPPAPFFFFIRLLLRHYYLSPPSRNCILYKYLYIYITHIHTHTHHLFCYVQTMQAPRQGRRQRPVSQRDMRATNQLLKSEVDRLLAPVMQKVIIYRPSDPRAFMSKCLADPTFRPGRLAQTLRGQEDVNKYLRAHVSAEVIDIMARAVVQKPSDLKEWMIHTCDPPLPPPCRVGMQDYCRSRMVVVVLVVVLVITYLFVVCVYCTHHMCKHPHIL